MRFHLLMLFIVILISLGMHGMASARGSAPDGLGASDAAIAATGAAAIPR